MTHSTKQKFTNKVLRLQKSTSSVEIEIGGTKDSGMVEHDTIYLKNANTKVTKHMVKFADDRSDVRVSQTEDGLRFKFNGDK